ncbi:MAG: efflux RND transporter periplasmic adaptor subunit [Gemmatimonadales bacterium]
MRQRWGRRALIGVAALVAGASACKKAASGGGPQGGGGMPPMPVEVAVALQDTVVDAIAATGQVEALQSVDLRPGVEGRIVDILVHEGEAVARGRALFKVDDAELRAQVARAEAERDLAVQALARTRQLVAQSASSAADLERAEATARSSEAEYELLAIRLERTTVRAPFAGVVGRRVVSLGDYVNTSTPLVSLQTVNPQRAAFQVPERYAERLRLRQLVSFRVAALPGQEFIGEVDFVDPVVRLPGRTIMITAVVPNPRRQLQAGMFIEAKLATEIRPSATVIPEDAVIPLQGLNIVWVAKDGKAERREVTLGVRTAGFVEVRAGVDAGEEVVVAGAERLMPGAPVMPRVVERGPVRES